MIGKRLNQIRKEKGMSQQALAALLGTSSGYISEIEQGKKMPGSDFLISLKRALEIDLNWFLTGDEIRVGSIDTDLLEDVVEVVDQYLEQKRLALTPAKKAIIYGHLYSAFQKSKSIDPAEVEDAVLRVA